MLFPELCVYFMVSTEFANQANLGLRLTAVVGMCGTHAGTRLRIFRVFPVYCMFSCHVHFSLIDVLILYVYKYMVLRFFFLFSIL
jgi:hypothetical protein